MRASLRGMDLNAARDHWADEFVDDRFSRKIDQDYGVPPELNLKSVYAPEDITSESLRVVLAEITDQMPNWQERSSASSKIESWLARLESEVPRPELRLVGSSAEISPSLAVGGPNRTKVYFNLPLRAIRRLVKLALTETTHNDAARLLRQWLPTLQSTPGLLNEGLFDDKMLRLATPWPEPSENGKNLLSLRGKDLFSGLGFDLEDHKEACVLSVDGEPRAIAVFCEMEEPIRTKSPRFNDKTPKRYAFSLAKTEQIKWVVLTRSSDIWLHPVSRVNGKVGISGLTLDNTFISLNLSLLEDSTYLDLFLSPAALKSDGWLDKLGRDSVDFAMELGTRLRERIYEETVPKLAKAVSSRICPNPTHSDLAEAYKQVMVILFRLLFVAYGEHTKRLPIDNFQYHKNSLKQLTKELLEPAPRRSAKEDSESTRLWDGITELWRAINEGSPDWGVPRYNGGLFTSDPEVSPVGATLTGIKMSDAEFRPALRAMLTDEPADDASKPSSSRVPVDFRSLSPRDFGTIYEGLLESSLIMADTDLKIVEVKGEKIEVPACNGDTVDIPNGTVYLQHRSGVRKSTGSYFTPVFAVEHLLDKALEPALDAHIARLDELHESGDEAKLAEVFFDFRCADIAMGSGHFLTAALDRIEARLSTWLFTHPVPGVAAELYRLRQKAEKELADTGTVTEIEDSALLRRLVARRCIYGADINPVAVELARLAVWIHTFVPGLPMSFLDHNLVCGDSLAGIATLEEAADAFETTKGKSGTPSMFIQNKMEQAQDHLSRLAFTADADAAEIADARQAHVDMLRSFQGTGIIGLFDIITAHRDALAIKNTQADWTRLARKGKLPSHRSEWVDDQHRADTAGVDLPDVSETDLSAHSERAAHGDVVERIVKLNPLHFPVAFPEVFLRDRPGFDCLIGNPPWEKVVVADKVWWGQYLPGIRSKAIQEMKAEIDRLKEERPDLRQEYEQNDIKTACMRSLLRVIFPLMGSGDTDLSKAFSWRNWQLTREGGYSGLVLPRTITRGKGSEKWRKEIFHNGTFEDVTTLSNKGGWVFEDVDVRYGVALVTLKRTRDSIRTVNLAGPFTSKEELTKISSESIPIDEFVDWSDDVAFPDLPAHPGSLKLFRRLRQSPAMKDLSLSLSQKLVLACLDRYERSMFITTRTFSSSTRESQPCCRNPRHSRPRAAHLRQRNLSDEPGKRQLACLRRTRRLPLEPRHYRKRMLRVD